MAPKRPPPIEEPPSASETSEEEELDDASEEEPPTPVQSSLKNSNPKSKPNPASVPKYKPSSDDSDDSDSDDSDAENDNPPQDSDSDSEEASDSDNEPVNHMIIHRSADAKPISSKPMMPPATPSAAALAPSKPSSSAAKRPLDGGDTEKNDKKTKKKKVSEIGDKGDHNNNNNKDDSEKKSKSGDDKKVPFQRIWSDEDEIVILNGLIDFKKKGYNVSTQLGAFFDFIKDSLHVVPNKSQLSNKVQRLKNKYQNNANRAKPGENPVISRPHEFLSYNLSKEIWGEQSDGPDANHVGTESSGKPDVKKTKTSLSANTIASPRQKISKQKVSIVPDGKSPQVETKEEDSPSASAEYHYLNQSLRFRNDPSMLVPPLDLGEIVAKKGWDSAKCLDATSLNKRWKNVMIAETKAYLARIDLVREQTKLMLDELESSDS